MTIKKKEIKREKSQIVLPGDRGVKNLLKIKMYVSAFKVNLKKKRGGHWFEYYNPYIFDYAIKLNHSKFHTITMVLILKLL